MAYKTRYAITFDPGGAAIVLLKPGDWLMEEPTINHQRIVDIRPLVRAEYPAIFYRQNRTNSLTWRVRSEYGTVEDAGRRVLTLGDDLPTGVADCRIQIVDCDGNALSSRTLRSACVVSTSATFAGGTRGQITYELIGKGIN